MTILVMLASLLVGYPLVYRQFSMLEDQMVLLGQSLATQVANNAVEPMFVEDDFALERLVNAMEEQSNVRSIVFVSRENTVVGTTFPRPKTELLISNPDAMESGLLHDDKDTYWFYAPISFEGVVAGKVWIGIDKSPLIENQRFAIISAILALAVLVAGIIWLSIRLSRHLSKPINELIEAAKAINSGQYSYRIKSSHSGEFARAQEAFNTMAESLEQKLTLEKNISRFVSSPVADHYMSREDSELDLKGERVEASILFVDLVSYTPFSEKHSPEVVAEVLNLYFSEFSHSCHKFNGNVDKFIGDCAMLVFGCPSADNLHRKHALECAIHIRDRIHKLNQQRKKDDLPWLDIRIGLAGGVVLAGLLGSSERLNYSVIGEAANLAARLCDRAPSGGILTDRHFLEAVAEQSKVQTHKTQRLDVKGFSQPVDALVVEQWEAHKPLKES